MSVKIYHPKGSMCAVCQNKTNDCSKLDFESMSRMKQYSHENDPTVFVVVKCTDFIKD